jgi:DNA-binding winged helix-turn-helix (wHTH) protein/tetratricopeptide (TPR) repeat protein
MAVTEAYEFGPFRLAVLKRLLLRDDKVVPLAPKAFETLLTLVRRNGQILTKAELIAAVWPDSFVEEANLAVNICALRRALADTRNDHRYIVTIPGQGYSFVAPVTEVAGPRAEVDGANAYPGSAAQAEATFRSIAVLPLTVLGSDRGDDYLGIGLADALTTRLSRLCHIIRLTTEVANNSIPGTDPVVLGRKLGVGALLCGTVRRLEDRLRASVQLIRIRDGAVVWADNLDERLTDLFAVEDSISGRVVEALTLKLSEEERQRLATRYTENTDAYHAYLRGRYCWSKRTEEGCRKGIEHFEHAIEGDPQYALAHAGLADCYIFLGIYSALPPKDSYAKATAVALKALEADDRLVEAHTSLAYTSLLYHWDFLGAELRFKRAVTLNPNYAMAHSWYSDYYLAMGRFDEAMDEMTRAQELDPVSLMINANVGEILFCAREYDRARHQLCKTIELDRFFVPAHYLLGLTEGQTARYDEAIASLQIACGLAERNPLLLGALGYAYAISGRHDQAHQTLMALNRLAAERYVSPFNLALVKAGLHKNDEAFLWLEEAYAERSPWLTFLNIDPRFDTLRSDRRFTDLIRRIGLTDTLSSYSSRVPSDVQAPTDGSPTTTT